MKKTLKADRQLISNIFNKNIFSDDETHCYWYAKGLDSIKSPVKKISEGNIKIVEVSISKKDCIFKKDIMRVLKEYYLKMNNDTENKKLIIPYVTINENKRKKIKKITKHNRQRGMIMKMKNYKRYSTKTYATIISDLCDKIALGIADPYSLKKFRNNYDHMVNTKQILEDTEIEVRVSVDIEEWDEEFPIWNIKKIISDKGFIDVRKLLRTEVNEDSYPIALLFAISAISSDLPTYNNQKYVILKHSADNDNHGLPISVYDTIKRNYGTNYIPPVVNILKTSYNLQSIMNHSKDNKYVYGIQSKYKLCLQKYMPSEDGLELINTSDTNMYSILRKRAVDINEKSVVTRFEKNAKDLNIPLVSLLLVIILDEEWYKNFKGLGSMNSKLLEQMLIDSDIIENI